MWSVGSLFCSPIGGHWQCKDDDPDRPEHACAGEPHVACSGRGRRAGPSGLAYRRRTHLRACPRRGCCLFCNNLHVDMSSLWAAHRKRREKTMGETEDERKLVSRLSCQAVFFLFFFLFRCPLTAYKRREPSNANCAKKIVVKEEQWAEHASYSEVRASSKFVVPCSFSPASV